MSAVRTTLVEPAHPYTRTQIPWRIDGGEEAYQGVSAENRRHWRLFHYISGGGLSFGRTINQEVSSRRQARFLTLAGVLCALWLVFYFI